MLSLDGPGSVIECGCFAGGSTAKLSILAKLTGRELVVFDSFEGLPEVDSWNEDDLHVRQGSETGSKWKSGEYNATLEHVSGNVKKFGEIEACRFVRGWFSDTLIEENLPNQIAFAFTDVDLVSSARDCLLAIWPRLSDGAVYFTHDVAFLKVLQALTDPEVWQSFREPQPVIFGAGYGLSDASPHLGMMIKGDLTPDYLEKITLKVFTHTVAFEKHVNG